MGGPIPLIRTLPCVKGLYTPQQNYILSCNQYICCTNMLYE
jgi:hypothetical protein